MTTEDKQKWTNKWKTPFDTLVTEIADLEGTTAKTALAQLNGLKDDMIAQLITWGGENETKRKDLAAEELKNQTLTSEKKTLETQISEFDTSGLTKQITELTTKLNGFEKTQGDETKNRIKVIALHPKFDSVKDHFSKVTVSGDKVTIADDITPEELTQYGDKIKTYDEVETFGKVDKKQVLDTNIKPVKPEAEKEIKTEADLKKHQKKIAKDLLETD